MINKVQSVNNTFNAQVKLKRIKDPKVFEMFEKNTAEHSDMLLYQNSANSDLKDEFSLVKNNFSELYYTDVANFTNTQPKTAKECVTKLVEIFNHLLAKSKEEGQKVY